MRNRIRNKNLPLLATLAVCILLYAAAAIAFYQYNFLSLQVLELLFSSYAPLGIVAIGMTLVILSGGIDLSVGSVVALSTMVAATLVAKAHWPAPLAISAALCAGALVGLLNGALIQVFELPAFLVTLATLFLARGLAQMMNHANRIALDPAKYPFFDWYTSLGIDIGSLHIYFRSIAFILLIVAAIVVARMTRLGRNIYAIGGNEAASALMGLPVGRTKILVYTISGLLAAAGGIVLLSGSASGDPTIAFGWELDAIAAVVIGGTLLSGGVGSIVGTLLGVFILALIEQIRSDAGGVLEPSDARIVNGLLLFAFIALQKLLTGLSSPSGSLPSPSGSPLSLRERVG